jgi:3-hydroxybutyryl-CoA dehydrogenase
MNIIGIAGGGKMGSSIFNMLCNYNHFSLIWYLRSNSEKAQNLHFRKLKRQLKNGLLSQKEFESYSLKQVITTNIEDLKDCDFIIETISEDKIQKTHLIHTLFSFTRSSCIIASNTSSININLLASRQNLQRMAGLHFFYPAELTNITELISSDYTTEHTINQIKTFLKSIGRNYLHQNTPEAFLLNRIMLKIQLGYFMLSRSQGYTFKQIDSVVNDHLFSPGVFETMDKIGIDLIYNAACNYIGMDENDEDYQPLMTYLEECISDNKLGVKTGVGFINYNTDEPNVKITGKEKQHLLKSLIICLNNALLWAKNNSNFSSDELEFALNEYLSTDIKNWNILI